MIVIWATSNWCGGERKKILRRTSVGRHNRRLTHMMGMPCWRRSFVKSTRKWGTRESRCDQWIGHCRVETYH
ncbi:hypothetical protein CY34DRAFT_422918 [Suillus luteus UH-Slu-Lm8-n1]|uniref:Uncharacterized protein n=1 Tax=Suillus luteus UH-Slu-Lm8-n1 TaxID=930992 RepID=A0A0D0AIF3_9AGAM|nr:hypothetical protein CY34DRAFT_422918 [Suillus luteus UH-Slu-Lm8-n1]